MIGLIQRVNWAKVDVDGDTVGKIDAGILLLLGVEKSDTEHHAQKLADKVSRYRIFSDEQGKMNLSLSQIHGGLLVVPQFTLVADTRSGNRPSFSDGAPPQVGKALFEHFVSYYRNNIAFCETGQFGADMQVSLLNDGPVTFQLQV